MALQLSNFSVSNLFLGVVKKFTTILIKFDNKLNLSKEKTLIILSHLSLIIKLLLTYYLVSPISYYLVSLNLNIIIL